MNSSLQNTNRNKEGDTQINNGSIRTRRQMDIRIAGSSASVPKAQSTYLSLNYKGQSPGVQKEPGKSNEESANWTTIIRRHIVLRVGVGMFSIGGKTRKEGRIWVCLIWHKTEGRKPWSGSGIRTTKLTFNQWRNVTSLNGSFLSHHTGFPQIKIKHPPLTNITKNKRKQGTLRDRTNKLQS